MSEFKQLGSLLSFSAVGLATTIHRLTPIQLLVYIYAFSLCYKGVMHKRMREISYIYISNELFRLFNIEISVRQVRRCVDKIVSLGLLERKTASFVKNGLPTRASYYRIRVS